MRRSLVFLVWVLALPGCVTAPGDGEPTAAPAAAQDPAYPPGSPYAPEAPYAAAGYAGGADEPARPYDSFCAEAVREAEAASALALASGNARDVRRAERTARFARRDCRTGSAAVP